MRLSGFFAASLIAISFTAHAEGADQAGELLPKALCEAELANSLPEDFTLSIDERPDHARYIQELQNQRDELTLEGRLPVSYTEIRGLIQYEHVVFLLSRGNAEHVVPIARTAASLVDKSYEELVELGKYISELQSQSSLTEQQRKNLVDAEVLFLANSQVFADNYGFAKHVMELLTSVANQRGIPVLDKLVTQPGENSEVVLDLTTPSAVNAAKRVKALWNWNQFSTIPELRAMFKQNDYAKRAKLERDIRELKTVNSFWRRAVNVWAQVLIKGSDKIPFLPEKYRQFALRLVGIQYNQFMKELYHGKIQELVGITRARTAEGKVVLVNDANSINTLLTTTEDMVAAAGPDLLVTFARTRYFAKSWNQLLVEARKRARVDATFWPLVDKIDAAEKARESAGDLPYLYEPNTHQEITLVAAQAAYMLAIEEATVGAVRNWIGPVIRNLLQ
jgi:hypothetical protein